MLDKNELFEQLHTDYYPMIHQMCMGFMKGSKDLADDLTQESFINIWRSLEKFRGDSSYKTWIYRITMNTCLKYVRDNKVKTQNFDEHLIEAPEEENNHSKQEKLHRDLYEAIAKLGEVDRFIVMMLLDEMDYDEIADVVGISEGNLRVKIHRIKKKLKKVLENG